jgi:hypothetical protein
LESEEELELEEGLESSSSGSLNREFVARFRAREFVVSLEYKSDEKSPIYIRFW